MANVEHPEKNNLDFSNTRIAFQYLSNLSLNWAHFLFKMIASPSLVKFSEASIKFAMRLGLPIDFIIEKTMYQHFVGGGSLSACKKVVEKLGSFGVSSVLDYAAEGCESEHDFDESCQEILRSIEFAGKSPYIHFAVFKMTAMARFALMEKIQKKRALDTEEQKEWQRVEERIGKLCQRAKDLGIKLMVDAEESWIQDTIDHLTIKLMQTYNTERAVVFTTLQMYRHNRLAYLKHLFEIASEQGFFIGVKFVRGAYIEKEHERAKSLGYESPCHLSKEATDRDYDAAINFSVENLDRISIFAGTHNQQSTTNLVAKMRQFKIAVGDDRIHFSQLYGMSDNLSFNLGHYGYNVTKYVPYGPVKKVMPYLFRRAEENTSIQGQMSRELTLIEKELDRRKASEK